ncbi:hypothetical protein [Aeromonas veronii]|uniref:ParE family toxin-like protein n=1 Tax=Aeromonas veronii TaxID=654 RepID=UPI003BA01510
MPKHVNPKIACKAHKVFDDYKKRKVFPRRAYFNRDVMTLNVGPSWRLICLASSVWELMTHESYNQIMKRCRP